MEIRCRHLNGQGICPLTGRRVRGGTPARLPAAPAARRAHYLEWSNQHQACYRCCRREALRHEPSAIQSGLDFIESHLTEKLTLEQVARHAGLSPGPFSGQLKKTTGCKFSHYIATRRIEAAKDLLLEIPRKKVSTVSDEAGFQSWPDFYFWFKRLTRLTPTEYRRYRRHGPKAAEN